MHRLLTKLAFENLLHSFQPFVFGRRFLGLRLALKYNVPLVFHGGSPWEYGCASMKKSTGKGFRKEYFYTEGGPESVFLGGVSAKDLTIHHGLHGSDLQPYLPLTKGEIEHFPLEYHFLGYYVPWDPQEACYCAVEQTGFEANPEGTEGTYSKYAGLDDRFDGFHYYTSFIKFGLARYDGCSPRNLGWEDHPRRRHRPRKALRWGIPEKNKEVLRYMKISEERFFELIDKARSHHLWKKENGEWTLRRAVYL